MNNNNAPMMDIFNSISKDELYFDEITYDLISQIHNFMDMKNISQKEISKNMNVKEPYLSRLLAGDQNITMKTLAKIMQNMGAKVHIKVADKDVRVIIAATSQQDNTPKYSLTKNMKEYNPQNNYTEGSEYYAQVAA